LTRDEHETERPLDEGTDPDPRFSFANERTFLAWIRTALALVAGGLAVTQVLPSFGFPGGRRFLGLPLMAVGAVVAAMAYAHWQASERAMRRGRPLPRTPMLRVVSVTVAVVAILAAIFAIASDT
jgi:putative membrane protein